MIPSAYFSTSVSETPVAPVVHAVTPLPGVSRPKLPQEDETKDEDLPPGFTAHKDPVSGRTFYVNTTTGISQWWAPKPPSLPSLPPPPILPPIETLPEEKNEFFSGEMTPMIIAGSNSGPAKLENVLLLLFKGRQFRTLYCFGWCALSMLSYVGITSVLSLFSINSMFSIASINSVFSIGSINSVFSIGCTESYFKICKEGPTIPPQYQYLGSLPHLRG